MPSYTRIGGTVFPVTGGKCRVRGTIYSINSGRCRVGGTIFTIPLKSGPAAEYTISVSGSGGFLGGFTIKTSDGKSQHVTSEGTYKAPQTGTTLVWDFGVSGLTINGRNAARDQPYNLRSNIRIALKSGRITANTY